MMLWWPPGLCDAMTNSIESGGVGTSLVVSIRRFGVSGHPQYDGNPHPWGRGRWQRGKAGLVS